MKLTEEAKEALTRYGVPEHMHGAIVRFYEERLSPGSFLTAVIDNDLREACGRADEINQRCLFNYVIWFYNCAPAGTWGFPGATAQWCKEDE